MPIRIPLQPPQAEYLKDHRFNGRPVLPAVETMALLATAVSEEVPAIDPHHIREARFEKFLPLEETEDMELWGELTLADDGTAGAALKSKRRGKRGIARTLTHARMSFGGADEAPASGWPAGDDQMDPATPPSPERIYAELVPFGPNYRNISAITAVYQDGIRADIVAPDLGGPHRLGSPFVLDAAFHAACVWGQRYLCLLYTSDAADERG